MEKEVVMLINEYFDPDTVYTQITKLFKLGQHTELELTQKIAINVKL